MKPDKIYISKNETVHGRLFDDDICYIREDALMDWLNEQEENGGPATTIQHIINRIKTL